MIKLMIIGNLGADAEMKNINGRNYISYSVCHTEKSKDGKEFSTWVNVMQNAFDENPRILPYLNKGSQVYVEGNPSVGAYIANDGNAKGSLTLWAFKVELVGGRPQQEQRAPQQQYQAPQQSPTDEEAYPF